MPGYQAVFLCAKAKLDVDRCLRKRNIDSYEYILDAIVHRDGSISSTKALYSPPASKT